MNFLLSANNHYLLPLSVCLTSILENHKDENINVYILQNDFDNENKILLNNLFKKYRQNINIIDVEKHYYDNVPVMRWSKETYYRLLLGELLPDNLDRILYLDCDIIINKNIKEFYDMDLKNNTVAALTEENDFREKIGLSKDGKYFQAGVLLFDVSKYKTKLDYKKSIEIIEKLGSNMIAVDQDVVNIAFDGDILSIDEKYNNCKITNFYGNNLYRLFNYISKDKINNTAIFHYASSKPWNNLFSGACEQIWNKYLAISPYQYLYHLKYNKLKYKILRSGIVKYLLYLYIHITPLIEKTAKKIFPQSLYKKLKKFYREKIK